MLKLVDLNPEWVGSGGECVRNADGSPVPRREAVGIHFDCPCGCPHPVFVPFANPADGLGPTTPGHGWQRIGETFDSLTLTPSIQRVSPCAGWHGFVTNGEVTTC